MVQKYFAKLLLIGEYTIIQGGDALAMPFRRYFGNWIWEMDHPAEMKLDGFAQYMRECTVGNKLLFEFDSKRFEKDIAAGMYFKSNIPVGYGLGSSGALCAAIYDRYVIHAIDRQETASYGVLKKQLAQMESYFHGKSSGVDPLICYLERPIWLSGQESIHVVEPKPLEGANRFFLLDSHQARETGPLVAHFQTLIADGLFAQELSSQLLPATKTAVQAYIAGDSAQLKSALKIISVFQFDHFQRMITEPLRRIWAQGLEQDTYYIKLCGAGGGGFYLGFTKEPLSNIPANAELSFLPL